MEQRLGVSAGMILLLFVVLYFAVKNGINQSILFSDDDWKKKYEEDMKKYTFLKK